ncbi:MAG: carbamoyltransferase HypF [Candidatus Caldarchaeum sp.]|nr:carbamoyltransferase HypF [Candidatus Caldarchaeum sp.]
MRAVKIHVVGIVQGVGFRPFVYRVARDSSVTGYVRNLGGSGVEIHVEGPASQVEEFIARFKALKPEPVYIEKMEISETSERGFTSFEILSSDSEKMSPSMIPPDFSICDACLDEVLTPTRWHHYPFNSCAFCGPRYSMIERIPYDRMNTAMADFPLCDECRRDYENPQDVRRFHAQGISCPRCGPQTSLVSKDSRVIAGGYDAIVQASALIDDGFVVAVKGVGGFHLAASATSDEVVAKLRERKKRPSKPFAVMGLNLEVLEQIVRIDSFAGNLLRTPARPIVLLEKKKSRVSDLVAPGVNTLGVFLPYTALHYLLLSEVSDRFCIMTSGNPPGEPMVTDDFEAQKKLAALADFFLVHNRRIVNRVDDSVVRVNGENVLLLRRGRGYAPLWISLPFAADKPVIAFGAMLQNAGCVVFEDKAVLTPYVGDVDELNTLIDLEKNIAYLTDSYRIPPQSAVIACDMHPSYPTTRLAQTWAKRHDTAMLKIQHHWAHIVSAMADKGIEEDVLGIAVDGAGYGEDGTVWGGEVMKANYGGYERLGSLRPQPMPGGDSAVYYPAKMLAGILSTVLTEQEVASIMNRLGLDEEGFPHGRRELEFVLRNIKNSKTVTSSAGRVFDAAAALLKICLRRSYEGEPAIKLESYSAPTDEKFDVRIENNKVDTGKLLLDALLAVESGVPKSHVAYMVQHAVGYGLGTIARRSRGRERFLVISGGAAVNEHFLKGVYEAIDNTSLEVVLPTRVPANDGGIALGQAVIAAFKTRE